ncbi:MAG: B12-binding domain-containing radical SAM protein [Desulfobacca sp. RBG_16_60_12]|nr:MAG: B12-binding domain-containing radical SAM protein [Desulfobacca sp. RBG_16_60_12]
MRVLLINPEFPGSFWSLQQSCELLGRQTLMPPLGLLTLAALLPADWELRLVDLNARRLSPGDWDWAELVMLSGMIVQQEGLLHLIREAKARHKTVLVGGPYATSVPQEILEAGADFLVRGEGEITIPLWLAAWQAGATHGVIEPDGRPEMTVSPVPRFDLLHLSDYIIMGIQTSRGCPFNCEFCDIVNLYGRKPRYKSPDQVLTELETLFNLGWRREIFFCDDNFIGNHTHARAILKKLIPWMESHGEPFSFWTQVSANLGHSVAMVDLLTEANFGTVFIGVESPDEAVLVGTRKYHNVKNPLGQSLTDISTNGLTVLASFIVGFDQEAKGAGDRIRAFVEQHNLPLVMVNLLQALPNTALWDRLKQENRLTGTKISPDMADTSFNFLPARPAAEIVAEYIRTVDFLYEPSRYLARTYRYYLAMRPTRAAAGKRKTPAPGNQESRLSFNTQREDLVAMLKLFWRQGIVAGYRRQFWRQLVGIYRQNPSRITQYLTQCGMGENVFRIRASLLEKTSRSGPDKIPPA